MQKKKLAERGALMVEMVAVVAVLGVMGTVLFRQMNQRNQELDNINMASEIRTVKEATMAYIQANRPSLEANCVLDGDYGYMTLDKEEIDYFMPDNWASNRDGEWEGDGIINEYDIYLTCYEIDSELAPRKALYATIIPYDGALPEGFTLRRAARVANLIGADGGVYTDKALHGTMGAWEVKCPLNSDGDVCEDRTDNFFVATTGVDIYIPEVEDAPDNAVVVPDSIAFNRLHSKDYFSVGDGTPNCIGNMTAEGEFAHKAKDPDSEVPSGTADEILNVGTGTNPNRCDPLFWVGTKGPEGKDNSEKGQVYVKNNLYIGRDNATNTHAVAIETGDNDTERSVTVFSADGDERLMLDGTGKVVGRSAGGKGYRLDAENGEIVLFEETEINGKVIQVPTMRLKDGVMRTDKAVTYTGDGGTPVTDTYKVDPAYTSLMNDIRLTSRGGARLSDILPNYITKTITSRTFDNGEFKEVDKPACPGGYVRAVMVTPVSWSQYITEAELRLPSVPAGSATPAITLSDTDPTEKDIDVMIDNDARLRLQHQEPVRITINNGDASWSVLADYSGTAATDADPISVVAQTYCVFDEANFDDASGTSGGLNSDGLGQETGTERQEIGQKDRPCSNDTDCDNTEKCSEDNICVPLGSCTENNLDEKLYCIDRRYVYVECTEDAECDEGKTCQNNRCKGGEGTTSA